MKIRAEKRTQELVGHCLDQVDVVEERAAEFIRILGLHGYEAVLKRKLR